MNRTDRPGGFERWLDRELGRAIAAEAGTGAPPPLRPARRAAMWPRARGAATAVAVALVVAAGVLVAADRPDPVRWGHQVVRSVSMGALTPFVTPVQSPVAAPVRPAPTVMPTAPAQQPAAGDQSDASAVEQKATGHAGQSHASSQGQAHGHGHQKGQNQQQ